MENGLKPAGDKSSLLDKDGFIPTITVIKGIEKGEKRIITKKRFIVGRKLGDLVISDSKVSSVHFALEAQPLGFMLIDLDSRNGTFLNEKRVKMSLLSYGDEIRIGSTIFKFDREEVTSSLNLAIDQSNEEDPETGGVFIETDTEDDAAVTNTRPKSQDESVDLKNQKAKNQYCLKLLDDSKEEKIYNLKDGRNVIGRVSADINLDEETILRKHAMIEISNEGIMLRDLSSKSGIYVNDRRILNCKLKGGEKIKIGSLTFEFKLVQGD